MTCHSINKFYKYKHVFEQIQDNVTYAKSCFITLVRLNVKWSRIKPYAQCMMCVATS
jgi:hypothetical protein